MVRRGIASFGLPGPLEKLYALLRKKIRTMDSPFERAFSSLFYLSLIKPGKKDIIRAGRRKTDQRVFSPKTVGRSKNHTHLSFLACLRTFLQLEKGASPSERSLWRMEA